MTYRIDYYTGDMKLGNAAGDLPFCDAIKIARRGLQEHNARFAKVIDPSTVPERMEIVHRDVLP